LEERLKKSPGRNRLSQNSWPTDQHLLVGARMTEESERFRLRAKQCRELAALARDDYSRKTLTQMAVELDEEADTIEAEEGGEG
jgi:hypothetical protein